MVFRLFLLTLWSCVVYGTIQQKIPNRNITMSVTICLGKNVMMWVRTIQMSLHLHGGVMCWKLNSFMFCAVMLIAWVKCKIASLLCGVHIPSLFCGAIFAPQKNDNHQFFCSVAIAWYKIYYSPMVDHQPFLRKKLWHSSSNRRGVEAKYHFWWANTFTVE